MRIPFPRSIPATPQKRLVKHVARAPERVLGHAKPLGVFAPKDG
jgi:hypothetical protein